MDFDFASALGETIAPGLNAPHNWKPRLTPWQE
jgi:hypothetical protein